MAVVVGVIAAPGTLAPGEHAVQDGGAASLPLIVTLPLTVVVPWVVMAPRKFICGVSSRRSTPYRRRAWNELRDAPETPSETAQKNGPLSFVTMTLAIPPPDVVYARFRVSPVSFWFHGRLHSLTMRFRPSSAVDVARDWRNELSLMR